MTYTKWGTHDDERRLEIFWLKIFFVFVSWRAPVCVCQVWARDDRRRTNGHDHDPTATLLHHSGTLHSHFASETKQILLFFVVVVARNGNLIFTPNDTQNPVVRVDGKVVKEASGQVRLKHGDEEVRTRRRFLFFLAHEANLCLVSKVRFSQEPFPLYPGETLSKAGIV